MQTKALATEAGYEFAFSPREGSNRLDGFDQYEVKRLGVGVVRYPCPAQGTEYAPRSFGKSFL